MSTLTVEQAEVIEAMLGSGDEPPIDTHSEDLTIESVKALSDGWSVSTDQGTGFFIEKREVNFGTEVDPQPGDTITLYTQGFSNIVGFDLNGKRLYVKSEREMNLSWMSFRAQLRRRRLERFAEKRAEMDRRYEELPAPLKARIDRFRAENPEFRVEGEAYEMAAAYDAPKIARAVAELEDWELDENFRAGSASADDVERSLTAFRDLGWEEQQALAPGLDDGHSGNTFGGAVALAYRLLIGGEC